jgi:Cellulase (glycosyl hydrolase family 5)
MKCLPLAAKRAGARRLSRKRLVLMFTALCLLATAAPPATPPRIELAPDGKGFVLAGTATPFRPWGLNYGNAGRLIEDFWADDWPTVAADFKAMKALGANVVRVHLQVGKFMVAADKPDAAALERLGRLCKLAEETGIYLDLTGLGCYRTADTPNWYDALSDADRWTVQARFWEAVAKACAQSPAVFCYDLMNEPISPGTKRKPGEWMSGKPFGGYDFVQWIALDPAGRPREQIARDWIKTLTAAIRKHDRRTLITVGLLPSTPALGHFSGFVPDKVAPELDFVSVHIYPTAGKVDEAITTLKGFAVPGKPLVIEETFNLTCPVADVEAFLKQSRQFACGWMGHYDGQTVEQLDERRQKKTITMPQAIYRDWLVLFRRLGPEMADGRGGR